MSKGPMKTLENTLETPIIPKKHLASNALNAPNQKDLPKTHKQTHRQTHLVILSLLELLITTKKLHYVNQC